MRLAAGEPVKEWLTVKIWASQNYISGWHCNWNQRSRNVTYEQNEKNWRLFAKFLPWRTLGTWDDWNELNQHKKKTSWRTESWASALIELPGPSPTYQLKVERAGCRDLVDRVHYSVDRGPGFNSRTSQSGFGLFPPSSSSYRSMWTLSPNDLE